MQQEEKDLKETVAQLAAICAEVFELTSRSVPSNHHAVIKAQVEKLNEIIKELK
jgi:hypothetical protein